MILETKFDFKKYLRLMYVITYRKPLMIFVTLFGVITLISSVLYFIGIPILFTFQPNTQLIFGLIVVLMLPLGTYGTARKNFASSTRFQEQITYEFTDEKIKITGESFHTELDWAKTYKIVELKNWILIYQNRTSANVIPKESFGSQLDDFKVLIKDKNIKTNMKR